MTLSGMQRIDPAAPVCHVSHYEADAFARWSGRRLPTEAEWEVASVACPIVGNFLDRAAPRPAAGAIGEQPHAHMFGHVLKYTGTQYGPSPGSHPTPGAIGA